MPEMISAASSAQQRFNDMYVTSAEIQKRMNIADCTVAISLKRGKLPKPVVVHKCTYIWEREEVEPYLERWLQGRLNRKSRTA